MNVERLSRLLIMLIIHRMAFLEVHMPTSYRSYAITNLLIIQLLVPH